MHKKVLAVLALLLAVIVTAACTIQGSTPTTKSGGATPGATAASAQKPVSGGTLRFGTYAEAATFDLMLTAQAAETRIVASLYDSLISKDIESGALGPGLAESWTVAPDGLS